MCSIEKLLIKGVRSFAPDNTDVIEFFKPLTIIVGHNGAGKTTIIECLKQVCTGELPPNTRSGQNFIMDPKVLGETEVKAQIKLRLFSQAGAPVVVVRSFQLTQKKAALQFKALDQVIQSYNKDTGAREALSYRCADTDRMIPNLMGVSKAILENVIFVHQEDSNWPLADGQTLKKKFDDIFAATKYTKALEALRKLRTEKLQEAKEGKMMLEHLKTHRDNAARLHAEVANGERARTSLQADIRAADDDIARLRETLTALDGKLRHIAVLDEEGRQLETRHEVTAKANAEARVRLVAAHGEDIVGAPRQELEGILTDMDALGDQQAELRQLRRDYDKARMEAVAQREEKERMERQQARLQAEADAHARALAERDRFLRELAARTGMMDVRGTGPLSQALAAEFAEKLEQHEDELQVRLATIKSEHEARDDHFSRRLDDITADLTAAVTSARVAGETLARNERRIGTLQAQMGDIVVTDELVERARARQRECEAALRAKRDAQAHADADGELARHSQALADLGRRASELRQERERLAASAEATTRQRMRQTEALEKEAAAGALLDGSGVRLQALLGRGQALPSPARLRRVVEAALDARKVDAEHWAGAVAEAQAAASAKDGELGAQRTQLHKLQADLANEERRLQHGLSRAEVMDAQRPVAEVLAAEAETRETLKGQVGRLESLRFNMATWKRHALAHHRCHTCERMFASQAEQDAFIARQEQLAVRLPENEDRLKLQLASAEQRLAALRALAPVQEHCSALRTRDVPAAAARVEGLQREADALVARLAEAQGAAARADKELQEARELLEKVAWPVNRLQAEAAAMRTEAQAAGEAAAEAGGGRTIGDVDADLDELEHARAGHERGKDEAVRRRARLRDEVSAGQGELHAAREAATTAEAKAEKRRGLLHDVMYLQAQNAGLAEQVARQEDVAAPFEADKQRILRERDEARASARAKEAAAEAELREAHSQAAELRSKSRPIEDYLAADRGAALAAARDTLAATQRRLQAAEDASRACSEQAAAKEAEVGQRDSVRRQMEECLAHQDALDAERQLVGRMEAVAKETAGVGDRRVMDASYAKEKEEVAKLQQKKDMALGSLDTVSEGVRRAQAALTIKDFHNIDERYQKQNALVITTKMTASDLEKYHKALEKALLTFHTNKMADINKIIKELWQKTYRNQDVDYIQLKADADSGAARSYNYRVVMLAGGAELDMRGRCSAGQKVLACLIIRLALAETFCLNCGILALDEPTTNLDHENSASLADALRQVMDARSAQANFQLVIITHDERFAHTIGKREYTEELYRISKDEHQHSHITRERMID
ncbi:hypothetical protein WJX81_005219 [Elliptochloris bilobata]|uniref:DNA repair protein RAD50 n=1 Tax=Elliptochloris bilobata TaxID=381761 RepID=A0AAW1SFX1_9CHLO